MNPLQLQEVFELCPYCNERISILLERSLENQQYIEDCEVCCRPISVHVSWLDEDRFELLFCQQDELN